MDRILEIIKSWPRYTKGISGWGWMLIVIGFIFPFLIEPHPQATILFKQIFCGIHIIPAVILGYYFGVWGAVPVVILGTFHHVPEDVVFFGGYLYAIPVMAARASIALFSAYLVGKIPQKERELERLNLELDEISNTDWLTGLYNSRFFYRRLHEEIEKAKVQGTKLSLLMMDIDDFKIYNDAHGHLEGESLLKDLGQLIIERVRENDVAVRYGGEEFAIILPDTDPEVALVMAEGIREAVAEYRFYGRQLQPGERVTVSGGVATYPLHAKNEQLLIQRADEMLCRAKESTKNIIIIDEVIQKPMN